MNADPLPPIVVVLPDGQEVRGLVHSRLQTSRGWMYQVGVPMWQTTAEEWVEPAELVLWVPAEYVRPMEGVPYEDIPTQQVEPVPAPATAAAGPPAAAAPAPEPDGVLVPAATPAVEAGESRRAWRIERLPRERGRPGWNVVHVHDCEDADDGDVLDLDQTLMVLRRPGTRACTKCGAAETLTPLQ
ncbi:MULTISPECIES: DUF6233 domain-containing protein [unclassified Streptomyces]|uniref:DUF6233 domain-containing protein n=1 Tax=unclassified Streptomyces TaxID=2593676 RepID=UPI0028C41B9C|nr:MULTISPECIES: DUF6233 domain-containing protein [unclassified Streptomyces]WNO76418.1 DUF6233 domain-containing protein [Streptomyces sp. AM8-1-1]